MRLLHRVAATVAALLTAVALALGVGITTPALAAPQQPPAATAAPARPALYISQKVVLPETSIDGPALSSVVGTFEGVPSDKSVIAWTGTDAAHHLNVETSKDGIHFGNKLILRETSAFRPDVTQMGEPAGGNITVAWTGTDANHSLNVLWDVYGSHPIKLTLWNENSFTAPAILQQGSNLLLAWTGTDANHSLNVLPITLTGTGLVPGRKTILSQFSSNAGPHLSDREGSGVVLSWTSRTLQPILATAADGAHFSIAARLAETSAFAPHSTNFPDAGFPLDVIAWTGTDTAHHVNLQFTFGFPEISGPKNVLDETALGGPALAFINGGQLAWTGTDAAHHLNIIQFGLQ